MLVGIGAVWFAAAAAVTFGVAHAAMDRPFRVEARPRRHLALVVNR